MPFQPPVIVSTSHRTFYKRHKHSTNINKQQILLVQPSTMSRYSQQPETPIRQSRLRTAPFTPLTPLTPSSRPKVVKNASPSALRTPLSSYGNIAFTPPPSLPRAPRTSLPKKSQGLESWRRPLGPLESPTRPAPSGGTCMPSIPSFVLALTPAFRPPSFCLHHCSEARKPSKAGFAQPGTTNSTQYLERSHV